MSVNWRSAFSRARAALMRRRRPEPTADGLVHDAWIRLASYEHARLMGQPAASVLRGARGASIDGRGGYRGCIGEVFLVEGVRIDLRPSAEALVLGRERPARLSECLGLLSEQTRAVVLAHRIEGLSYQEIARLHGLTVSSVEKHIAKATLQLTSWMEGW